MFFGAIVSALRALFILLTCLLIDTLCVISEQINDDDGDDKQIY